MATTKNISVIIAIGVEVRDWPYTIDLIEYLNNNATPDSSKANHWSFDLTKKKIKYNLRIVFTKSDFQKALDEKDAFVVYDGHSRYGQGPAFGPSNLDHCPSKTTYPTNPWEDNYRMGWDTIKVPCEDEILNHCTNPTEFPHKKAPKKLFARRSIKTMLEKSSKRSDKCKQSNPAKRKLLKCYPTIARKRNGRGEQTLLRRHYWEKTSSDFSTLIQVGNEDLKKVSLRCKVLFMNSCSSKWHFYYALKRQKKTKRSKCAFYMTRRVCSASTTEIFIKSLFAGHNPTSKKGSKKFLKAMGISDSGLIQYLR